MFGIENIPYGIGSSFLHSQPQCVTRYEDEVIFLAVLQNEGLLEHIERLPNGIFNQPTLNAFASLPKELHKAVRTSLQGLIHGRKTQTLPLSSTAHIVDCQLYLPVSIGDFTDFSCSVQHNLNASEAIFGQRSLPPAFYHYPMGYGGRTSSIVVSETPIQRPWGMYHEAGSQTTVFAQSRAVDFELEIGCIIGKAVRTGQRCSVEEAREHIFGLVLLNDWSARDIQGLEMRPFGPFNGKSFGTTISPWVITPEALEFVQAEAPAFVNQPAPYLRRSARRIPLINLRVEILKGNESTTVCQSRSDNLYWTFEEMIAHQTVNGCGLRTGDILATGTVSGAGDNEHGCLLETTSGGKKSFTLSNGSIRTYLEDGDTVRIVGFGGEEARNRSVQGHSIGFGECIGEIFAAKPST